MSRATRILALGLIACLTTLGCAPDEGTSETDREIAAFEQALSGGKSFADACNELQVLCTTTGFGCKAHTLFCQVPTQQQICQQLAAACPTYPAACDVYKMHCGSQPPSSCGDNTCDPNAEDCQSCPQDCGKCQPGQTCGDGFCDIAAGEDCKSCPLDCTNSAGGCGWGCGDGLCDMVVGEDCQSCPKDCGQCQPGQGCGDGKCDPATEDCKSCPQDCANSAGGCNWGCGDGQCDASMGEDCQSCPKDCGQCNTGPNSGQLCDQNKPCPQGDSCMMWSSNNTYGMCVASCSGAGATCPSSVPGTTSTCALTDASGALYCVYLCEAQGQTFSCPAGLACVAQPNQNVKICLPK